MSSRNRIVAAAIVSALAVGATGVGVGMRLKNPNSIIPVAPKASRTAVPVEMKRITTSLVARGSASLAGFQPITVPSTTGSASVLTKAVAVGTDLKEGDVVLAVDDVPMFALKGKIPAYRDLKPGDNGRDVLQLDEALKRLGKLAGTPNDQYDEQTERAVEALFRDGGALANGPKKEELEALTSARKAVLDADVTVFRARQELSTAIKPPTDDALIGANEAVASANDAVDSLPQEAERLRLEAQTAVRARERAVVDAEAAIRKAQRDLEEANRNATDESAIRTAERAAADAREKVGDAKEAVEAAVQAVEDAKSEVKTAEEALPIAQQLATTLNARATQLGNEAANVKANGPRIPTDGTVLSANDIAALVTQAEDAARDALIAARQAELSVRNAEREIQLKKRAVVQAERGVDKAKQAVSDAELAVPLADVAIEKARREVASRKDLLPVEAEKPGAAADVLSQAQDELANAERALARVEVTIAARKRTAVAQLSSAQAALRRLRDPANVDNLKAQVTSAEQVRATAEKALVDLEAKTGITLPQSTYVFVSEFPTRVASVDAQVGSVVPVGPVMTVSGGGLLVDGLIENGDRNSLAPGMRAAVEFPDYQLNAKATITTVSKRPDKNDPSVTPFQLALDSGPLKFSNGELVQPFALSGAGAKITIELGSMKEPGLVVPISAIVTRADRSTVVLVEREQAEAPIPVPVRTGMTGSGEVEIIPTSTDSLRAGDLVIVASTIDNEQQEGSDSGPSADEGPSDSPADSPSESPSESPSDSPSAEAPPEDA
jgi:peptidoglycan hydrolase-like protein with peptidoglycan-binding domain